MDKRLIHARFSRSIESYAEHATAQRRIATRMCRMLETFLPTDPGPTLEVGCGTGLFTRLFLDRFRPQELLLNDLCPEVNAMLSDLTNRRVRFLAGDAEHCPLPAGRRLIVSCSTLQWFDDPERFLNRCHDLLLDNGLLAFSTFGRDNLFEIAALTGKGLDYRPLTTWCATLKNKFRIRVAEEERIVLHFPSPLDVLRHMRETGVTGIERTVWTRGRLTDFAARYRERYHTDEGSVALTYHPIYILAEKT